MEFVFSDNINRAVRVQFSPHVTATHKVSSPTFLSFTALQPELP
jgi:hypothetical protein